MNNKCPQDCEYQMIDADTQPCRECHSGESFVQKHSITTNEKLDRVIELLEKLVDDTTAAKLKRLQNNVKVQEILERG